MSCLEGRFFTTEPPGKPYSNRTSQLKELQDIFCLRKIFVASCGFFDPRPLIKPASPTSEGRFLTPGPPGKSHLTSCSVFYHSVSFCLLIYLLLDCLLLSPTCKPSESRGSSSSLGTLSISVGAGTILSEYLLNELSDQINNWAKGM